ncbi:hypothetical protein H0H81_001589 [Sphagnurus paluster]|uniref:Transcriptional adapter 2 n=1 Tax=Sphagnurus paluster TaxID=117069 RepID=A0A9P7FVM2_9AGAR|nr:hypothetical protein H0H81_001589 [Sphagnurus paluster]
MAVASEEINSYPIFTEDWGADEELLLLTGIASQGIGNWKKIAEHIGTRTKEEVEKHYNEVYVDSPHWPLPVMDREFTIDLEEFQERKRRRISSMNAMAPPPVKIAPTSAPGIHEIATFLPGRLEFEHELDNDAEDLIKDLEFGMCLQYGGDQIPEDDEDLDVRARLKWLEEHLQHPVVENGVATVRGKTLPFGKGPPKGKGSMSMNGKTNGYHSNSNGNTDLVKQEKSADVVMANGTGSQDEEGVEEPTQPPPFETEESLKFKLTVMEMYAQRIEKRLEGKAFIFNRGLLEYKKMQAAEKKRPREEREILHRLRPFAKLQTAEDYEAFASDMLYEAILRKKILDLQTYRRLGLTSAADIEKYEADLAKRAQAKANPPREYHSHARSGGRHSSGPDPRRANSTVGEDGHEREVTPRLPGAAPGAPVVRRPPAPLNLANSPSLHLLTPAEQTLCSTLRILPKPYLVIKETLVREYARRGGKLRRREARDLVKIDVNKTSRIWDFLVQAGFLKITQEPAAAASVADARTSAGPSTAPSLNGSPLKEAQSRVSPLPPPRMATASSSGSYTGSIYNGSIASTPSQGVTLPWPTH